MTDDELRRLREKRRLTVVRRGAYLPADELLIELLERISEILHVDTAAILLLEPSGEMLRARAAKVQVGRGRRLKRQLPHTTQVAAPPGVPLAPAAPSVPVAPSAG